MVMNLLMYLIKYEIKKSQERTTGMLMLWLVPLPSSTTSLTPINIEYENIIITIKNIGKISHDHVVEDFIEDKYYVTTCINVYEWYQYTFYYLKDDVFLITFYHNARIRLKKIATKYVIIGDLLYRMSFDGAILRYLIRHKVEMALHQAHDGEYGGHFSAKFVYQSFLRLDYYWPTML